MIYDSEYMHKKSHSSSGFSTVLLAIVIGVVALVGIGGFYMMNRSSTETTTTATPTTAAMLSDESAPTATTTETAGTDTSELTGTFTSLISRGQSLECDWRMPVEAEDNPFGAGKLWTTGNQGRSTITTTVSGMSMEANAIYRENTAYTWMDLNGTKMGFMFSPEEMTEMDSTMTPQERQQAEQIRQEMVFNCQPWVVDESKFVLPADVEFKTY